MSSPYVIWVDDEPNLIAGEIFDLSRLGYRTVAFHTPCAAYDSLLGQPELSVGASAIIIDILMPSRGDPRFTDSNDSPSGVVLCDLLRSRLACWNQITPWVTLYTRSGSHRCIAAVMKFVAEHKLHFARKNAMHRIAEELLQSERIKAISQS